jgi:ADP-dependent phosphofructokinase/glucokinase
MLDYDRYNTVNRLEIIDDKGRSYIKLGVTGMTFDLQDQGKTLKIFVSNDAEQEKKVRNEILDELTKFSQLLGMYDDQLRNQDKK